MNRSSRVTGTGSAVAVAVADVVDVPSSAAT
jgi:hypothetical protein